MFVGGESDAAVAPALPWSSVGAGTQTADDLPISFSEEEDDSGSIMADHQQESAAD